MGPFEMVVAIIAIVTIGGLIKSRHRAKHGIITDMHGNEQRIGSDGDAARMREEIKTLKDRIAVLERLATDSNSAVALDREIEKLR
jgi:hypothetical protein